jgi:hypothetical protein
MLKCVPIVVSVVTLLAAFAYIRTPVATPAPATAAENAQEKLEIIRKRLPEAINRGMKSLGIVVEQENIKVQLIRRLSATEAKATVTLGGGKDFSPSFLTFYLRYYEGEWTTIRHEERCEGHLAGREKYLVDLALAIDELGKIK